MSETDIGAFEVLKKASESKDIPKIYFNSASCVLHPGDISMVLEVNENPVAVINMSLTTAKSIAAVIGSMIADVEERTGSRVMTFNDARTAFREQ
ncbi:MAG: hypothetical protein L7F77_11540 [Candidatus Magnetominusculus sp. LBB02]|nr:hypothetical protein [Candidatus Magnetominusculus sp. LBB02]